MITTETRNAGISEIMDLLQDQRARSRDFVVPATGMRAKDGKLMIKGVEQTPEMDAEGEIRILDLNGTYGVTKTFDQGLAAKLGIPGGYLGRLREGRVDLYDGNVNGLLHGRSVRRADGTTDTVYPADERNFLVRTFSDPSGEGIARALLSDRYGVIDNLEATLAVLDGIKQAGVNVDISSHLTEQRLYMNFSCPEVYAMAPTLLGGYRSPFDVASINEQRLHGRTVQEWQNLGTTYRGNNSRPVVFAGFTLSNSEVGAGAFSLTPRLVVQVCSNGMTINALKAREVHIGSTMEEGVWSRDTERKALALISSRTTDLVQHWLSPEFIQGQVAVIEAKAGAEISQPEKKVSEVSKTLKFTKDEQEGILAHFIKGGQTTAGGLLNAVTSYAQVVKSADRAAELEGAALRVLDLV